MEMLKKRVIIVKILPKIVKNMILYKNFLIFILPFAKKSVTSLQNCKSNRKLNCKNYGIGQRIKEIEKTSEVV